MRRRLLLLAFAAAMAMAMPTKSNGTTTQTSSSTIRPPPSTLAPPPPPPTTTEPTPAPAVVILPLGENNTDPPGNNRSNENIPAPTSAAATTPNTSRTSLSFSIAVTHRRPEDDTKSDGLSSGAILGILGGCLVVFAAGVGFLCFSVRRKLDALDNRDSVIHSPLYNAVDPSPAMQSAHSMRSSFGIARLAPGEVPGSVRGSFSDSQLEAVFHSGRGGLTATYMDSGVRYSGSEFQLADPHAALQRAMTVNGMADARFHPHYPFHPHLHSVRSSFQRLSEERVLRSNEHREFHGIPSESLVSSIPRTASAPVSLSSMGLMTEMNLMGHNTLMTTPEEEQLRRQSSASDTPSRDSCDF
ncbi:Aste57867_19337 [Aphanomyces stellatus]|uniref:Aste57867_19337 protein n=1 Tax=Aphanomyces stellatus TaxID=120398 RepID=A0A485LCX1_9STRA|nr:hypothetical protein As57867_019273 [Aphanomyces stellatus]VFT96052.1 Aste57867_19337 [Aphanomyces stellatus]